MCNQIFKINSILYHNKVQKINLVNNKILWYYFIVEEYKKYNVYNMVHIFQKNKGETEHEKE